MGGKSKSRSVIEGYTAASACLDKFYAFYERHWVSTTGSTLTFMEKKNFPHIITYNNLPHYFESVLSLKYEFVRET